MSHKTIPPRLRATLIHLAISLGVALLVGIFVFRLWYPYPYSEISDGSRLFKLIIAVDVTLGPLLTLIVFNVSKPLAELRRDLIIIVVLQIAGLGYGMWTTVLARPVFLVFEIDRFRVVHAIEIPRKLLTQAPQGLSDIPLFGQRTIAIRPFKSPDEKFLDTYAAIQGLSLSARPDLWQPYADSAAQIRLAARPAAELIARFPAASTLIRDAVSKTERPATQLIYVPLVSRHHFWTALLDAHSLDVVGFVPLDSFK